MAIDEVGSHARTLELEAVAAAAQADLDAAKIVLQAAQADYEAKQHALLNGRMHLTRWFSVRFGGAKPPGIIDDPSSPVPQVV